MVTDNQKFRLKVILSNGECKDTFVGEWQAQYEKLLNFCKGIMYTLEGAKIEITIISKSTN